MQLKLVVCNYKRAHHHENCLCNYESQHVKLQQLLLATNVKFVLHV